VAPAETLLPPKTHLHQHQQQQQAQRQVSYASVDGDADDDADGDAGPSSASVDGSFDAGSAATMPPDTSPEPVPPPGHLLSIHRAAAPQAMPARSHRATNELTLGPAKLVAAANRPASAAADTFTFTAIKPRGPVTTLAMTGKDDATSGSRRVREAAPPAPVVLRNVRVSASPIREDDAYPRRPVVGYVPPGGQRGPSQNQAPPAGAVAFTFAPISATLPLRRA
jgi:hypothetical protein